MSTMTTMKAKMTTKTATKVKKLNVEALRDEQLLVETWVLSLEEQQVNVPFLRHLEEVGKRKLYRTRGYGSLVEWICGDLGYSEEQARYRLEAMRALRDVPAVQGALESGELTLAHLVKAQRFFQNERAKGKNYSAHEKLGVIRSLHKERRPPRTAASPPPGLRRELPRELPIALPRPLPRAITPPARPRATRKQVWKREPTTGGGTPEVPLLTPRGINPAWYALQILARKKH